MLLYDIILMALHAGPSPRAWLVSNFKARAIRNDVQWCRHALKWRSRTHVNIVKNVSLFIIIIDDERMMSSRLLYDRVRKML